MNEVIIKVVPSGLVIILLFLIYGRLIHICGQLKKLVNK